MRPAAGCDRPRLPVTVAAFVMLACGATAAAQDENSDRLRLKILGPSGARSYLTENGGVLGFALSNSTAEDIEARVLTFYATDPGRQYGRDVWVPAKAALWSW